MPDRLVIDNLKTGVIKPDLYDPKLNRAYAEMAEHYGCLIDPARAEKPRDKPRVERMMPYVRDSLLAGPHVRQRRRHAGPRGRVVHDGRRHPGAPQPGRRAAAGRCSTRSRRRRCGRCRPRRSSWSAGCRRRSRRTATSGWTGCFTACRGRTSGSRSTPGSATRLVRGLRRRAADQDLAAGRTGPVHRPGRLPAGEDRVLHAHPGLVPQPRRGASANTSAELVDGLLADDALHHLRAAQGIIGLADKYGPDRLDAACRRALDVGDPTYRTVRGILAVGADSDAAAPATGAPAGRRRSATRRRICAAGEHCCAHLDERRTATTRRWER